MPAQDPKGRYIQPTEAITSGDVASAARTTTGNGTAFDTSGLDSVKGLLVISAASGTTPTLDLALQTTADGTNYYSVGAFTQKVTTTAGDSKIFGPLGDLSRWSWTIAGTTPSFTFAVTATADKDS